MRESKQPQRLMTLEEYLAFEEQTPIKHEYVAGEVYAMSGATTRHNIITLNVAAYFRGPSRTRGCRVFAEAVKLQVRDRIYYPDVIVACGKAAEVELIVEEPSLIVEVSSRSTRATDRREKLDAYMSLASLQHYLIVDQRRKHVLVYARNAKGEWVRDEIEGDGKIEIPFLGTQLTTEQIYEDVQLPPLSVNEGEEEWNAEEWDEEEGE